VPGILGVILKKNKNRQANENLIRAMLQKLSHNDNYVSQSYAGEWFAIGNIGLPVEGEDRFTIQEKSGYAAAFSGYIYGWKNLDANLSRDTANKASRLIEIYQRHKDNLPTKIDGSFNIAVVDIKGREFLICNDRFGHRQLYYYEDDDLFLFSTEIKAFLAYDKFIKGIDLKGVSDYFNYGYLLGNKTFFKDVKILRGGHNIIYKNARITFQKYWDYKFGEESKQTVGELIEEADTIYIDIIRKLKSYGENTIVPLSGGLDSRFIIGHTVRAGLQPYTFTHGKKNCLDHKIAHRVAQELELKNYRFVEVNPDWFIDYIEEFVFLTEGMIDSSPAILLGINRQYNLNPKSSVFLNGIFGGPTNFGSVFFTPEDLIDGLTYEKKLERIKGSLGGFLGGLKDGLFDQNLKAAVSENYMSSIDEEFRNCLEVSDKFYQQRDVFFLKNNLGRYMNQVDCSRFIWHDHFALANDRLVDFYMRLPARLHFSRRFMAEYFKVKFPTLAAIPYQATGVDLYSKPSKYRIKVQEYIRKSKYYAERISKGKLRFYDMRAYIHPEQLFRSHNKMAAYFQEILLDDRTASRGYYNMKRLETLFKWQKEGGYGFYPLSSLLAFEVFNRLYMDR